MQRVFNLKEIIMKQLVKVHMLPTEDLYKGIILLRHLWKGNPKLECRSLWQYNETVVISGVKQYTTLNGSFRDIIDSFKPQHLHFTSDEDLKEGDWTYDVLNNCIEQVDKSTVNMINAGMLHNGNRKIVATTDPKLTSMLDYHGNLTDDITKQCYNGVPQISQSFIEEYVKAGGIDEVYLEYEELFFNRHSLDDGYKGDWELISKNAFNYVTTNPESLHHKWREYKKESKFKTDQNNCVITHPIEPKLYTREEVINILTNYNNIDGYGLSYNKKRTLDNWIEENLK